MKIVTLNVIEIQWEGPFTCEHVEANTSDAEGGLYQVYGTHAIFGPNALLYIGQTGSFSYRLIRHQNKWIKYEASEVSVYLGHIGSVDNLSRETWQQSVDHAEKLLIYYTTPPYNGQGHDWPGISDTVVLNLGKRNRLPHEVSSCWEQSDFFLRKGQWKPYPGTVR